MLTDGCGYHGCFHLLFYLLQTLIRNFFVGRNPLSDEQHPVSADLLSHLFGCLINLIHQFFRIRVPVIGFECQQFANKGMLLHQIPAFLVPDLDHVKTEKLLSVFPVKRIPEGIRHSFPPVRVIRVNHNAPHRPAFEEPGVAGIFIGSFPRVLPGALMLDLNDNLLRMILNFHLKGQKQIPFQTFLQSLVAADEFLVNEAVLSDPDIRKIVRKKILCKRSYQPFEQSVMDFGVGFHGIHVSRAVLCFLRFHLRPPSVSIA